MNEKKLSALLTGMKMMCAGILAFIFFLLISWQDSYWAVLSVAAVTRPGLTHTYLKGISRSIGTFLGAFLSYLSIIISGGNKIVLSLCFFVIISASCYFSMQRTFVSFFSLIVAITVTIILATIVQYGESNIIIVHRIIDVMAGILAIWLVNMVLRFFFPKKEPLRKNLQMELHTGEVTFSSFFHNTYLIKSALGIGLLVSATFLFWLHYKYSGGYWITIYSLLIMGTYLFNGKENLVFHFLAHLLMAMIGAVTAVLIGDSIWLAVFPVSLVFFLCGYMMVNNITYGKAANTMAFVFAIMLLSGTSEGTAFPIIMARFVNSLLGLTFGFLFTWILITCHAAPPPLNDKNKIFR